MSLTLDYLNRDNLNYILKTIQDKLKDFWGITLDTDGTLTGNSDEAVASQKAIVSYSIPKSIGTAGGTVLGFSAASTPAELTNVCRIKTGTYTGDGSTGTAITGVGFRPKFLWIFQHPAGALTEEHFIKVDQTWGDYAFPPYGIQSLASKINSLNSDGFTVDDAGGNADPNAPAVVYDYIALGI